ncbi:Hsp70 family protein [Ketogulonicigenium robustum]|nr:Hsp70 family protein [Ketogulonicigenium robustum]
MSNSPVLAVDFGTSNTAAAVYAGGAVRRIPLEQGDDTLPTAVFFPANGAAMQIGHAATRALIDGAEGRFMRALKSILGTALFHESRLIGGKRRTLADIVTAFLTRLKTEAEGRTGLTFTAVLSGRPVHFHSNDPVRDVQAEADLRACYAAAGFTQIDFLNEPEAAAHAASDAQGVGLIVDIGGGTSDFTVFRRTGAQIETLASHGIRLGGTDFDQAISLAHVMPLLGLGGTLKRDFGPGLLPVPNAIYVDLATWAKIPFLYTPETRRAVADLQKHATDRTALSHLATVIEDELGHSTAFAVERGKIAANSGQDTRIPLGFIAKGLAAPITPASLTAALTDFRTRLLTAITETLAIASTPPEAIENIVFVGGSSLMEMVTTTAAAACPQAKHLQAEAFTAVVDGLAIATRP